MYNAIVLTFVIELIASYMAHHYERHVCLALTFECSLICVLKSVSN